MVGEEGKLNNVQHYDEICSCTSWSMGPRKGTWPHACTSLDLLQRGTSHQTHVTRNKLPETSFTTQRQSGTTKLRQLTVRKQKESDVSAHANIHSETAYDNVGEYGQGPETKVPQRTASEVFVASAEHCTSRFS